MTDQEINIAIAEACGWSRLKQPIRINRGYQGYGNAFWQNAVGVPYIECPNYCNDLNAMAQAEKTLTRDQWGDYCFWITERIDICQPVDHAAQTPEERFCTLHATARQRAEAFLKTLGKWKK